MSATLKAVGAVGATLVGLRLLQRVEPADLRVDLSPDTRPDFAPESVAPLRGFVFSPCVGGGITGPLAGALAELGLRGRFTDDSGTPYNYNAARVAQGHVLSEQLGRLPSLMCNSSACLPFAGASAPRMDGACAAAVAKQWAGLVDKVRHRPELQQVNAFSATAPLVEIDGLVRSLELRAAGVTALSGTTLDRRVQEIWATVARIATRLDAALNLVGHERISLGAEVAEQARDVAGEVALGAATAVGALGKGALGAAARALLSEFGALVAVGALTYYLVRRRA